MHAGCHTVQTMAAASTLSSMVCGQGGGTLEEAWTGGVGLGAIEKRLALAQRIAARVITDLKLGKGRLPGCAFHSSEEEWIGASMFCALSVFIFSSDNEKKAMKAVLSRSPLYRDGEGQCHNCRAIPAGGNRLHRDT